MIDYFLKSFHYLTIALYALSLIGFLVFKDNRFMYLYFGLLLSSIVHRILKQLIYHQFTSSSLIYRPKGNFMCDSLFTISQRSSLGMPSGHVQSIAFYLVLLYLLTPNATLLTALIFTLIIILQMASRIYLGCHTFLQTVIGLMVGIVLALTISRTIHLRK